MASGSLSRWTRTGREVRDAGHPATVAVFWETPVFGSRFRTAKSEDGIVSAGQFMYVRRIGTPVENTRNQSFEVIAIELKK
jgi:hypothetical protein